MESHWILRMQDGDSEQPHPAHPLAQEQRAISQPVSFRLAPSEPAHRLAIGQCDVSQVEN
jgi:hypothetical protein